MNRYIREANCPMKNIYLMMLAVTLTAAGLLASLSPVEAQPAPPLSPEATWQPPDEGGEALEPQVGVDTYRQTWPNLQMLAPSPVPPGVSGSITNAYLVNSRGQLLSTLYGTEACYLVVSFNSPGYFYLWEYYPSSANTYGHWLIYRWYRPYAGVWKIGPFTASSGDPDGRYIWKMWFVSSGFWSTRTLGGDYLRGYNPYGIPDPVPQPSYPPVINSFSANLPSIELGQTVTLTWTTSNASSVSISPGIGTVGTTGSTTVTPLSTTSYTLTATGITGNPVSSSATVTVMPRIPPGISAAQAKIQSGQSTILSWNAPAAVKVFISGVGSFGSSGTTQVKPEDTTVYTLTASYIDGTALTASATVTVEQPPYLLYGLIALLAVAAAVIVALLVRRPSAPAAAQSAATQPAAATAAAVTSTAVESPATSPVIEAAAARLAMPDGSEVLLAGNARSLGRKDFEKFLPPGDISYLSRQHINIWFEEGKYYIEDRSSTNGTSINGTDIKETGRHVLQDGDAIDLAGKLNITFKL
jgi:hypothetical protein